MAGARPAARLLLLLAAAAGTAAADARGRAAVTPIQKVLTLMTDMLEKGKKEKKAEEVKFAKFTQWCSTQQAIKTKEIKREGERIEELDAGILKAESAIRGASEKVQELDEDVARWEKDQKSATDVWQMESQDFTGTISDYQESIDALGDAITVLKKQAYDRAQPELVQTLLQLKARPFLPQSTRAALVAFLQQPSVETMDQRLTISAPEANAYEFQSGGVVDMLTKLKDQFDSKLTEARQEQLSTKHGYEMIMQQLTDNIENAKHEANQQSELLTGQQQLKAQKEGEKAQSVEEKNADTKYKEDTAALCNQKASDFKSRQELRAGEIETLTKAIGIISNGTVAGAGEKYLPALLQSKGKALAQMRSDLRSPLQARIAAFLADRARLSGSRLLSQVSQRVAEDPFVKVKRLIKDLISQLMEEGTAETEHKGWCDTELGTNKQTRETKSAEVSSLSSEIEDLAAQIAQLTQDLADLAAEVKELDVAMAQATEERTESKESHEQTIKEAKEAQAAVGQALAVVKEFYAKSAQATALEQQTPAADAPETFDKPYRGMLPEGGNIVDFLEVIVADFTRLESETAAAESAEADAYEKFMFESKKDKALKENSSKHKDSAKSDREMALHTAEADLKASKEQLSTAVEYYEKLKPTCVDSGVTYEERVRRREEEMQSLQEALKILSGEDMA